MRVFLTCYSFQIHPKGRPKDFLKFNDLPGTTKIFRDALMIYLNHIKENLVIEEAACHRIDQLTQEGDMIYGTFVSGDYGHSSKFRNVKTNANTFNRTPDDAEQIPYHFLFSFDDKEDRGIMITQKLGVRGIHTSLRTIIHQYLSQIYGVIFDVNELVPTEVYEYLKKGDTTKVVFNNIKLPHEQASMLDWHDVNVEEIADIKLIVQAKRGYILPISDRIKNQYTSIVEKRLPEPEDVITGLDFEVNFGGNHRMVRVDKPNSFTPMVDVSAEVRMENGIPNFEDVLQQSQLLLEDVKKMIRGF